VPVCVFAAAGLADPPEQILDAPFYSFDADSPTVQADIGIHADDILAKAPNPAPPNVAVDGVNLGLGQMGDEIDALSSANAGFPNSQEFLLLFSIDRASVANAPPHPLLVAENVLYNALDQAARGHGSGDQFMSLDMFTRAGGPASRSAAARVPATSVQTKNQYNEGGSDFGGEPKDGSARPNGPIPQDNVVSMMLTGRSGGGLGEVYFSVTRDSPSLAMLPGDGGELANGAYIFFNPDALNPGSESVVFASSTDLGLDPNDDIDAMIVFDTDGNGIFNNPIDHVLFSLAHASPSLVTIPGASAASPAAHVFQVGAGSASPSVFALAENMGLGNPLDNVDALDYVVCVIENEPNPTEFDCALQYGIRGPMVPAQSDWGLILLTLSMLVVGAILIGRMKHRPA